MKGKREVILWELEGALAIVLEPSGVVYSNQTCGHACMQSKAEGVLVPFNNDYPLDNPEERIDFKLSKLLLNIHYLDQEIASEIDQIFDTSGFKNVRVDRLKLKESHEAWLYVDIEENEKMYFLKGFGNCKAVLTWQNSD